MTYCCTLSPSLFLLFFAFSFGGGADLANSEKSWRGTFDRQGVSETPQEEEMGDHPSCVQQRWDAVDLHWGAGWWKEHFEELLNLTNPTSTIEAELEEDGGSTSVFLEEVAEVVKKFCSGKAPGIDEICLKMVKALDVEGLSWMTCCFNIA